MRLQLARRRRARLSILLAVSDARGTHASPCAFFKALRPVISGWCLCLRLDRSQPRVEALSPS